MRSELDTSMVADVTQVTRTSLCCRHKADQTEQLTRTLFKFTAAALVHLTTLSKNVLVEWQEKIIMKGGYEFTSCSSVSSLITVASASA